MINELLKASLKKAIGRMHILLLCCKIRVYTNFTGRILHITLQYFTGVVGEPKPISFLTEDRLGKPDIVSPTF